MVYVTSDTHRELDIYKINPSDGFVEGKQLTEQDIVLICGDFGCILDGGQGDRFWLNWLDSLPWQTCFIDGNHENFDLLESFPIERWHGGLVHRISKKVRHLMRGELFDFDGRTYFTFGGGYSHDRQYRQAHVSWWPQEIPNQQESRRAIHHLKQVNYQVDVVVTHEVPGYHPHAKKYPPDLSQYDAYQIHLMDFLNQLDDTLNYDVWLHGHYHHDDQFILPSGKTCIGLYERCISIDTLFLD